MVPLAGCEEVNWSELMLTLVVPLAGCEELVVPISINVVVAEPLCLLLKHIIWNGKRSPPYFRN